MRSRIVLAMALCSIVVLGLGCGPAADAPEKTTAGSESKGAAAKAEPCCPIEAAAEKAKAAAAEAKGTAEKTAAAVAEAAKETAEEVAAAATEAKGPNEKPAPKATDLTKKLADAPKKLTDAVKAAAPALKLPAPAAPSSGKVAKAKMMALIEAAKANDLAKTQAAAKDLCASAAKHKAKDAAVAAKPDYQKMEAACIAAVKKVADAKAAPEAAKAAGAVRGTCSACHEMYKH